ncbi:MAG: hypothetical protein QOC81_3723 [Thermoanaerobaculia bacterium]|jgi:hypothetical protein|nr:hypothetical protein [Thermoanaerobaculia bacterium]
MRLRTLFIALTLTAAPLLAQTPSSVAPAFQVDLAAKDSSKLPALQSFSAGQGSDGKWLIAGGRSNGLHLFVASSGGGTTPPPNAFPTTYANQNLYVIDPGTGKSWSAPLSGLPAPISDALSANNAESYASGGFLYVVGGYGWSTQYSQMITYGTLTSIQIDPTIKAIIAGQSFTSYVQQTSTYFDCNAYAVSSFNTCFSTYNACNGGATAPGCPCPAGPGFKQCLQTAQSACLQQQAAANNTCITMVKSGQTAGLPTNTGSPATVAGGGMEKVGDTYVLVFGQDFEGLYSVNAGDYGKWPVNQTYTQAVTTLWINPPTATTPLSAATLYYAQQNPSDLTSQWHRRDLNVVPGIATDGKGMQVQALGGVFVPGSDSAYRQPIRISLTNSVPSVTVDSYQQYMSQYECGVVPLFNRTTNTLTNILLGGISLYYVDGKTGKLKADTGLPFISALSALSRSAAGDWSEFYRVAPIAISQVSWPPNSPQPVIETKPVRVGTDAKFMRHPKVAASENGVIWLDAITTKTLVGWMYGGIQATGSSPGTGDGTSNASSQLWEIWLDPTAPPANYWASVNDAPQVIISLTTDTYKK